MQYPARNSEIEALSQSVEEMKSNSHTLLLMLCEMLANQKGEPVYKIILETEKLIQEEKKKLREEYESTGKLTTL